MDAADASRVVGVEAGVEIERNDRRFVAQEQGFGLAQERGAVFQVSLLVGFAQEVVVAGVLPTGAVVAAGAGEEVEEGVRVVVIPHPTGA